MILGLIAVLGLATQVEPEGGTELPISLPAQRTFSADNDLYDPFGDHSDQWYTQAFRYQRLRHGEHADTPILRRLIGTDGCMIFCAFGETANGAASQTGMSFGHAIWTPADISEAARQPDDRPWAGLVYVGLVDQFITRPTNLGAWSLRRRELFELRLGLIGPLSGADFAQTEWHEFLGGVDPAGWDHQLPNELVVQADHRVTFDFTRRAFSDQTYVNVAPSLTGRLGTYMIAADASIEFTMGWDSQDLCSATPWRSGVSPPPSSPPPAIPPPPTDEPVALSKLQEMRELNADLSDELDGEGRSTSGESRSEYLMETARWAERLQTRRGPACDSEQQRVWLTQGSIFAQFTGRAVAHNIVLDGSLFRNQDYVDHRPYVWETSFGVRLSVWKRWGLSYRYQRRGSEFNRPSGGSANVQEFGTIMVEWVWRPRSGN